MSEADYDTLLKSSDDENGYQKLLEFEKLAANLTGKSLIRDDNKLHEIASLSEITNNDSIKLGNETENAINPDCDEIDTKIQEFESLAKSMNDRKEASKANYEEDNKIKIEIDGEDRDFKVLADSVDSSADNNEEAAKIESKTINVDANVFMMDGKLFKYESKGRSCKFCGKEVASQRILFHHINKEHKGIEH